MDTSVAILIGIAILAITVLSTWLSKNDKNSLRPLARSRFVLRPPLMGTTNPRKSGLWYTTNWFAGEKVNEAIRDGKARYAHKRYRRHR